MITLVRGDAAHLPLPDGSVDLIVTSPPYFALRSYQDQGGHYAGQIGSEATPGEFIDALVACTAEWVRVLKPSGSLWVNLGDKYNSASGSGGYSHSHSAKWGGDPEPRGKALSIVPTKSLLGLPWRYALRCIDDLGLILRAEVIWSKPNGLPESVTDRVRRSHEQWFHLVKQPRYYAAVDTIREPQMFGLDGHSGKRNMGRWSDRTDGGDNRFRAAEWAVNPLGKLPGSVWSIPSQPLTVPAWLGVDHFAAFPMELPRRIIQGWSPSGICTVCGEGRRPVVKGGGYDPDALARRGTASQEYSHRTASGKPSPLLSVNLSGPEKDRYRIPWRVTGECCACTPYTDHPGSGETYGGRPHPSGGNAGQNVNAGTAAVHLGGAERVGPWREYHDWTPPPTRPAVVLDPFSGTGTVALMADVLGRHGIGVDLSHDYCRLARWRTTDSGERARAMQVDKPEAVADGQMQLFA